MHEDIRIKKTAEQINWELESEITKLQTRYDNDKYYYDAKEARQFYRFSTKLKLDKGKKNKIINLIKFQFEICSSIICVKRKVDDFRRFREAHINIPRKNGKSFIVALISAYLYFCNNEFGSETILSANTSQQASLLFNTIKFMIENNVTLKKRVKITDSRKFMYKKNMNAYMRVISSDAANADSYAAYLAIIDEIHEAKNRDLYDKLKTGGGIWNQPLLITITTASSGSDPHNLEFEMYNLSKTIESGNFDDDSFYFAIYEADKDCDLLDEEQWFKANPALGTFRKYDELKSLALRATQLKTQETAFRRLYLNQHVDLNEECAINMDLWDVCVKEISLKDLKGWKYWAGLDMSISKDITAYVMVFFDEQAEKYIIYPFMFTPKDTMSQRIKKDNVRYDVYAKRGELIPLKGKNININHMINFIEKINSAYSFDAKEIACDRYAARDVIGKLEENYDIADFGQGFVSMSPAIRDFENFLIDEKLIIANNGFLRWMATNVIAVMDDSCNIKYSKKKSKNKIDGIIAMIMALARAIFNNYEKDIDLNKYTTQEYLDRLGLK